MTTEKETNVTFGDTIRHVALAAVVIWATPCLVYSAPPSVGNVQVKQDESRLVTISYTLSDAPAIVTLSAFTNGVSIGGALLGNASGALNKRVEPGNAIQTITWQPRVTWPDQKITNGSFSVKLTAWALDNPPDYMAVDLTSYSNRIWYASAEDVPGTPTNNLYKCDWMLFRRIHAEGVRWRMGVNGDTTGKYTPHAVVLTNDYYMAIFEGTIGQRTRIVSGTRDENFTPDNKNTYATYEGLRGAAASGYNWPTDGHAVAADSVIGKFRTLTGLDSADLPTEAEWEYACRAGSTMCYHWGNDTSQATYAQYDWLSGVTGKADLNRQYGGDGSYRAQKVGLLKPSPWGLYDMHGNCYELCLDWYSEGDAYCVPGSEVVAPVGPASNANGYRTLHSGSWMHNTEKARAGNRSGHPASGSSAPYQSVGYRLSCSADLRNLL